MSNKKIDVNKLDIAIAEVLKEYHQEIFIASEEGLKNAEKILIKNLKANSPVGKTGDYQKSWKGKKYKLKRYVGNTKVVTNKKGKEIPLSNILEYSKKSKHQGKIKATYESSVDEMANAILKELKK